MHSAACFRSHERVGVSHSSSCYIQPGENLTFSSEHIPLDDDIYSDLDQPIAFRKGKQSYTSHPLYTCLILIFRHLFILLSHPLILTLFQGSCQMPYQTQVKGLPCKKKWLL